MRFVRPAALAALLVTSVTSASAIAGNLSVADQMKAAAALDAMSKLNVIALNDLTFSGGEIEGKAYVGRDWLSTQGSNGSTQIGFGQASKTTSSTWSTLTVGRNLDMGVKLTNNVGGSFGAFVVGNGAGEISMQSNGGSVKVGGNLSAVVLGEAASLQVVGNYTSQNGISVKNGNTIEIGGSSTKLDAGDKSGVTIKVNGNLGSVSTGAGAVVQVGGNLGTDGNYSSAKSDISVLGSISKLQMNSNGIVVKSGASVSEANVSNGSNLYASGSIGVQNNNGTIHANCGATYAGAGCTGVSAPTAPGVPVIGGISMDATEMADNFATLQSALKNLSIAGTHGGSATCVNGNGNAVSCGVVLNGQNGNSKIIATLNATNTNGYSVINITEQELRAERVVYNFSNTTTPVIINVTNTGACALTKNCSYTIDSDLANGNNPLYTRNVVWNFADASSVILNKQFQGSIIAALANLQQVGSNIEGSVIAKNLSMKAEIHLGTYSNNGGNSIPLLTGVIPEPANWALMISGFGIIGGVVRRRRSFAVAA